MLYDTNLLTNTLTGQKGSILNITKQLHLNNYADLWQAEIYFDIDIELLKINASCFKYTQKNSRCINLLSFINILFSDDITILHDNFELSITKIFNQDFGCDRILLNSG